MSGVVRVAVLGALCGASIASVGWSSPRADAARKPVRATVKAAAARRPVASAAATVSTVRVEPGAAPAAAATIVAAPPTSPVIASSTTSTTSTTSIVPDPRTTSRVAVAVSAGIDVFPTADSFTRDRIIFGLQDSGAPTVFLVVAEQGDRYQVQLPIRPNGTTGWIERRTVKTFTHAFRIQVGLNAHEIVVTNGSAEVLRARIGVGRTAAPTPGGTYYTTQLLKTPNPNGAYGPYAYGLSGFSETLASFGGGEAVIGLHGTNRPDLLGGDVSSGCIRLANADITYLAGLLPIGVPVVITS